MKILQKRIKYYPDTTISKIYVNGKFFCYGLEDTVRPAGIKVAKFTAIPENLEGYKVSKHRSHSFNRLVVILHTEKDGITLKYNGVTFTYVYAHGGNKASDTDGCVLVAFNRSGNKIYNTAERTLALKIFTALDNGEEVKWIIQNLPQKH